MPDKTRKIDFLQEGGDKPEDFNDLIIAEWSEQLVNQFPDKIDHLKFPRAWTEYMFEEVKIFYYIQFAFYLVYVYAQYWLVQQGLMLKEEE